MTQFKILQGCKRDHKLIHRWIVYISSPKSPKPEVTSFRPYKDILKTKFSLEDRKILKQGNFYNQNSSEFDLTVYLMNETCNVFILNNNQ